MKLQYLGDAKDAFKWDYLDFLAKEMGSDLCIVPMLTPDDRTGQGRTSPLLFPASDGVAKFCRWLRKKENRELKSLCTLPDYTGGGYQVEVHEPEDESVFRDSDRKKYFGDIEQCQAQILFLDPDIGFQPQKTINAKHVRYSDIRTIWPAIAENTAVVVFQHARRKFFPFAEHYKEIRRGLSGMENFYSTALFWCDNLMFFVMGKSCAQIDKVRKVNIRYQKQPRPVQTVGGEG